MSNVFIPKESSPEARVAATPETVARLVKEGLTVTVEAGAGVAACLSDVAFEEAGAQISHDGAAARAAADVVLGVAPPSVEAAEQLKKDALLVTFLAPHRNLKLVKALAGRGVTAMAMEFVPRITRAQKMDALSSQASIAGYKAAVLAASRLGRYFPLMMTAAGTVQPARVVVMGAGVAGLQALATAKRLGAVVEVSDIRPSVKEQVESLGGRFIDLPQAESGEGQGGYAKEMGEDFLRRQREIISAKLEAADVVITTALIPGRPAPRLVTKDMVARMKAGSVIVDLAVEQGGNCELTQPGETVTSNGVLILGPGNLPATLPQDASALYARNLLEVMLLVGKKGEIQLDLEDEIVKGMLLTHAGEVRHAPTAELLLKGAA